MDKVVINRQGTVLVKVDGIVYQINGITFNTIKNIIFDIDKPIILPICKHCNKMCDKKHLRIEDSKIINGLTTVKGNGAEVMVFECSELIPERNISGPVFFYPEDEELSESEKEENHYGDAYYASIEHPKIKEYIRKAN